MQVRKQQLELDVLRYISRIVTLQAKGLGQRLQLGWRPKWLQVDSNPK